ncbi:hypothetical protein F5148DRAFT_1286216 [Russula earlei]|uniref:Uncharacterized protein n=1 Tax=Russula earlei TaxID=71964 RepID=A0ACC0U570_9AGAM|nr:hypothetical protein F5148DRAFT_1286216 [Russula earlei]
MLVFLHVTGQTTDQWLAELDKNIEQSGRYDATWQAEIDALKKNPLKNTPAEQFTTCLGLYEAYKIFNYDSAFDYAKQLQVAAARLNDPSKEVYARIKLGFTLISSGMFKETLDSLNSINIQGMPDSVKAEYYSLMGRYYYDLGDFDNDTYHTPLYIAKGNKYIDSALQLYPPASFSYSYYTGLKDIKSGNNDKALLEFQKTMSRQDLTHHQLAVAASTLSDIYIKTGQTDTAMILLIRSAIADIQSSTKENAAIFNLAQLLYKKGDVKRASSYIEKAIADAGFYGARQRKVQVSSILPLIEGEKISRVEGQKTILITYSTIATVLLLLVVVLAAIILRQVKKLQLAKQIITTAHHKEQEINYRLTEANKIKEEYIGYFFNTNSEFFAKIEKFKEALDQKVAYRKLDEVMALAKTINLKKEKEELLKNFDKVFLKLFPNFVDEFNAFFHEEDRIKLKGDELLNTDLRIFALIRMGIHDTEKIAQILEYSVNTINTYKTKIKNKSIIPNEEFEHRIMAIKTV